MLCSPYTDKTVTYLEIEMVVERLTPVINIYVQILVEMGDFWS